MLPSVPVTRRNQKRQDLFQISELANPIHPHYPTRRNTWLSSPVETTLFILKTGQQAKRY
jgi:hypothetical protein